jgi:hypothetical protein
LLDRLLPIQERGKRLDIIEIAINQSNEELNAMRNKKEEELNFRSKVKWFEFGEKSNKFFLNLQKQRADCS